MAIITKVDDSKILPKFVQMSPYEIYINQVKGCVENIRFTRQGLSYTPPQFGGIFGQRNVMQESVVLQLIDFKVN